MRVIQEPPQPQYGGRYTCKGCKAILAYTKSDVYHHHHDPDGEFVKCPFCETEKDVTPGDGH